MKQLDKMLLESRLKEKRSLSCINLREKRRWKKLELLKNKPDSKWKNVLRLNVSKERRELKNTGPNKSDKD